MTLKSLKKDKQQGAKVAVIGAGSWGSMLADNLNKNGNEVRLWARNPKQVHEINTKHTNSKYLKNFEFSPSVIAYLDLERALEGVSDVVMVVPSQVTRLVAKKVNNILQAKHLKPNIIHASKGLEKGSNKRLSEILQEEINPKHRKEIAVLSGPSQAEATAKNDLTAVTVASDNKQGAQHFQKLFMNKSFRVYTNQDIIGVELGGSLKNIIALGGGILAALGYGDNAKGALITRGLAEISRLGKSLGANPLTFMGLAGVGDMIATATSKDSRNWQAGYALGKGQKINDIIDQMGMVIEGIDTTSAAYELAKNKGVEMPITTAIYRVLNQDESISQAIYSLMARPGSSEL